MRKYLAMATAMAVTISAAPAWAGDSEDFAGCDGLMKPKSKDDGMRGVASISPYSSFGLLAAMGAGFQPARIDVCTRALNNPKLLPTQTLRRAHLLRARASNYLEQGKTAEALADLDAAEAATIDRAQDPLFRRSMGVSLILLRAIAKAQQGDRGGAVKLADEAQAMRPFALQVQTAAAVIRYAQQPGGVTGESPLAVLVKLDPSAAGTALSLEAEGGNFAQVVALAKSRPAPLPDIPSANPGGGPSPAFMSWLNSEFGEQALVAYAHAATGDLATAKRMVADARARVEANTMFKSTDPAATAPPPPSDLRTMFTDMTEPRLRLVDARIAVAEGRPADAAKFFDGGKFPLNAATMDLLRQLKAAPATSAKLPDLQELETRLAQSRGTALGRLASGLLIAPESQRTLIDYQKSRPNILSALIGGALTMGTSLLGGIERTAGFRSATNPDGTVKVEYVGNTASAPMVQEMTLLRAAELARAANKAGFVLTGRQDYSRYMVMSRGGMEQSRTPIGYKTELVVRYLDDPAANPAAFDAVAVIDALGPFYYQN